MSLPPWSSGDPVPSPPGMRESAGSSRLSGAPGGYMPPGGYTPPGGYPPPGGYMPPGGSMPPGGYTPPGGYPLVMMHAPPAVSAPHASSRPGTDLAGWITWMVLALNLAVLLSTLGIEVPGILTIRRGIARLGEVTGITAPRADPATAVVRIPPDAHAWELFNPPSITVQTYAQALAEAQHPMAADASRIYARLLDAGIDPAIHLALVLRAGVDPPSGAAERYNPHHLMHGGRLMRYLSYDDGVRAWIALVQRDLAPTVAPHPVTLTTVVTRICLPPACDPAAEEAALRAQIASWRDQRAGGS